jgi:IclR family KDG regulon transcriptional repressor
MTDDLAPVPLETLPDEKGGSRQPLLTVMRALTILRLFDGKLEWLGVREIARRLDMNSASVHNLLRTLAGEGLLEQHNETKKYRLGLGLVALAGIKLSQMGLVSYATPLMRELMHQTEETTILATLYRDDVLFLARFESSHLLRVASQMGGTAPLHCSAVGKVLLAFQGSDRIETVLSGSLEQFSARTVTDPSLLREELERIRKQGFAVDFGGYIDGVHAVAAPVQDHSGQVVAALGLVVPASRFPTDKLSEFTTKVVQTARQISRALGAGPTPP